MVALSLAVAGLELAGAHPDPVQYDEWLRPAVSAGGLVFVSAQFGTRADGSLAGPGIEEQTARALERMGEVLAAHDSSLARLATVTVLLRQASDFAAMNEAYRAHVGDDPPARTTVVSDLPGEARIAISAVAVRQGRLREVLHPAGWVRSPRPYSYIVRTEHLVFFSGLVSRRGQDDQPLPGPIGTQMKTILDNAGVLLRTAGLTYRDVVSSRVFITDELSFGDMNDAYRRVFAAEPPARATAVMPLVAADAKVEMTFVASTAGREALGPTVAPSLPLSAAVAAGPFVFLSGVLGNTDANAADAGAQMRESLTRIGRTLETAGVAFADVVDAIVYLRDPRQRAEVESSYREFFPADPPARSTLGAQLVAPTGLVEVMAVAAKER